MEGGGSIILEHFQASLSDGEWHSVQLSVESRLAVLVVDNITQSASLHTPIRTGEGDGGREESGCNTDCKHKKHVENLKRCKTFNIQVLPDCELY